MINDKQLREAAKELVSVLGLVDEDKKDIVITKATSKQELTKIVNDVIEADLITDDDDLSPETMIVLDELTPKKGKGKAATAKAKPAPEPEEDEDEDEDDEDEDEDDEDEEEVAEKIHQKNVGSKKVNEVKGKKAPVEDDEDEDEDEDEEEVEVKKPAKKAPAQVASVHRAETYGPILLGAKPPKTLKEWAEKANALYMKNGGKDCLTQAVSDVKWCAKLFSKMDVSFKFPKE